MRGSDRCVSPRMTGVGFGVAMAAALTLSTSLPAAAQSMDALDALGADLFDPTLTADPATAPAKDGAAKTEAAPAKKAGASKGVLEGLASNATYQVEGYYVWMPQRFSDRRVNDDKGEAWSRATVTTHTNLADDVVFKLKAHALANTQVSDHEGAFRQPGSHDTKAAWVDLDQAALTYEQPSWQALIGKEELKTGLSTLYSPANRFQPGYTAFAPNAFKTGTWQARTDLYINNDTLQAVAMPFDDHGSVPATGSRWLGAGGNSYFSSLPANIPADADIIETFRGTAPDEWGYLLNYKATRQGYDWFAYAHRGPGAYPVITRRDVASGNPLAPTVPVFEMRYPTAWSFAGGLTATVDRWEFHGEAIYQKTVHDMDQDFGKYVVGVSYRETEFANSLGLDEIQPVIEYAGEIVTDESSAAFIAADSSSARTNRNAVISRVEVKVNSDLLFYGGVSRSLVDRDTAVTTGGWYEFSDDFKVTLDIAMFSGEPDTNFGRWTRNDYVKVGAKKSF
ncbi:MAG: hypothetical protein ACM3Q1_16885 [Bacteroidales bacterium]